MRFISDDELRKAHEKINKSHAGLFRLLANAPVALWLDDRRDPVLHGWPDAIWAKNVDQAVDVLRTRNVTAASFDHDVQFDGRNGLTVVEWMRDNDVWPTEYIIVHSTNVEARKAMLELVRAHYGRDFQQPEFQQW